MSCVKLNPGAHLAPLGYAAITSVFGAYCSGKPEPGERISAFPIHDELKPRLIRSVKNAIMLSSPSHSAPRSPQSNEPIQWSVISTISRPRKLRRRCWSLFPRRRCSKFPPSVSARYMYVSDVCALYIAYFLTRSLNAFIVVEFMYIHTYIHKIHQICNLDIFHSKYTYLHKFICQCAHVPSTYMRSYLPEITM